MNETHDIGTETAVRGLSSGDHVRFDDVWLGESDSGPSRVVLRASAVFDGTFSIRTGNPNGPVLATFPVNDETRTPNHFEFDTFNQPALSNISGVHDIYITAETDIEDASVLGFINFLQFSRPGNNNSFDALPTEIAVSYEDFEFLENRRNHGPAGVSAMQFPRIGRIINELGGEISFEYGQDNPCTCLLYTSDAADE